MANARAGHGVYWDGITLPVWLGADPDLAMVTADPVAWSEAHPCECEGVCECEPAGRVETP